MGCLWKILDMAIQIRTLRKGTLPETAVCTDHLFSSIITSFFLLWNRYAEELVKILFGENAPNFGAASDGMFAKTSNLPLSALYNPCNNKKKHCMSHKFNYLNNARAA